MKSINQVMEKLSLASLVALALFLFCSFSLSASHHILLALPGVYFFYRAVAEKKLKRFDRSSKCLLVLTVLLAGSILANWNEIARPWHFLFKIKYFVFGFLAIYAYQSSFEKKLSVKNLRFIIHLFLFSAAIASISGLIGYATGFNPLRMQTTTHASRASGMYGMTITYSFAAALLSAILMSALFRYKKVKKYCSINLLVFTLGITLLGLFFSFGRGAIFGLLLALPFIFVPKKLKLLVLCTVLLILSAFGYIYLNRIKAFGLGSFRDTKKVTLGRTVGKQSGAVRYAHLLATYYMVKEHPFFGVGFRNYESRIVPYKQKYKLGDPKWRAWKGHAHNNFLEVLGGAGLFAFIAFVGFHVFWLMDLYRRNDLFGDILIPFVIVYIGAGMFQSAIIDGETQFFLMAVFALSKLQWPPANKKNIV